MPLYHQAKKSYDVGWVIDPDYQGEIKQLLPIDIKKSMSGIQEIP